MTATGFLATPTTMPEAQAYSPRTSPNSVT